MPRYCDIHSHLNFNAFKDDADEVIRRTLQGGVWTILVGSQIDTSERAVMYAEKYKDEGIFAAVGLHPIHLFELSVDRAEIGGGDVPSFTTRKETFDRARYAKLAESKKAVAIGECGLDYFHLDKDKVGSIQKKTFIEQIHLANDIGKPLMLHIRSGKGTGDAKGAYKDALEILRAEAKVRGDVHFFAGDWDTAKQFLDLGFTLSFTGVITFTRDYDEVIRNAPLDMIMTETDSPYVAPQMYRGKRNEPLYVKEVVKRIAEIRGDTEEHVAEAVFQNARHVFNLPPAPRART